MECANEELLANYVGGELTGASRERLEGHLDDCPRCAETVALVARASVFSKATDASGAGAADVMLEIGARIGRYVVMHELGRGAMGAVYEAYDAELDRKIALKIMTCASSQHRSLREARAMARLSDPNVVNVYDVLWLGELVILAMERVDGRNLREWLGEGERSHDEIRALMLSAGRGLVAAHRAGVVHCDFKPDNVLVGPDGRARVTDFGLAQVGDASAVGGTPGYMAPEQREGGRATAASDQYSYCLSFAEALTGTRAVDGAIGVAPRTVSRELWTALARGTAKDPARRFPSMAELLDALEPRARKWRLAWVVGASTLAAAAMLSIWLWGWFREEPARACASGSGRIETVWSPARRATLQASFREVQSASTADTLARVLALADKYADDWALAYVDNCKATHVRGEQSEALLDRRTSCLQTRLTSFAALLNLLETATDKALVDRAQQAMDRLPAIADCAEVERITAITPMPEAPEARARIERLTQDVFAMAATLHAGKIEAVLTRLVELRAEIEGVDYPPLTAHFRLELGVALEKAGRYDEAAAELEVAAKAAASAHDDVLLARVLTSLMGIRGHRQANVKEGKTWAEAAELALRRAQGSDELRAAFLHNRGMVLITAGEFATARESFLEGAEVVERSKGKSARELVSIFDSIGTTYYREEDFEKAADYHRRAIDVGEAALGKHHLGLANPINNLGLIAMKTNQHELAIESFRRSRALLEDALGPDNPSVAMVRVNTGLVFIRAGELDPAQVELEAAVPMLEETLGAQHPMLSEAVVTLAQVASEKGDLDRAIELQLRAIELRKMMGPEHPAVVKDTYNLASLYCRAERFDEADASYDFVDQATRKATDARRWQATVLIARAGCALMKKDPARALRWTRQAAALPDQSPSDRLQAQLVEARALHLLGRNQQAEELARIILASQDPVSEDERSVASELLAEIAKDASGPSR